MSNPYVELMPHKTDGYVTHIGSNQPLKTNPWVLRVLFKWVFIVPVKSMKTTRRCKQSIVLVSSCLTFRDLDHKSATLLVLIWASFFNIHVWIDTAFDYIRKPVSIYMLTVWHGMAVWINCVTMVSNNDSLCKHVWNVMNM